MDKDILKLLPQKAFKLLSLQDTLRIGALVTRSVFDSSVYASNFISRQARWNLNGINVTKDFPNSRSKILTKEDGEKILKIYFSQYFDENLAVHLDLRENSFSADQKDQSLNWIPSKLHYKFSSSFKVGVCELYEGFYFERPEKFENGLKLLSIINDKMNEMQKENVKNIFYKHFGEGRTEPVRFSLKKMHESFNAIFAHFFKEDIQLNPEFAVLGVNIVTLYLTLQEIPFELNVNEAFKDVFEAYRK